MSRDNRVALSNLYAYYTAEEVALIEKAQINFESETATLRFTIAGYETQRSSLMSELAAVYLGDSTINGEDSLRLFLETQQTPEAMVQLLSIYVENGDSTRANALLPLVSALPEWEDFAAIQNLNLILQSEGRNIFQLTVAEKGLVVELASGTGNMKQYAEGVLEMVYETPSAFQPEEIPLQGGGNRQMQKEPRVKTEQLVISPNPTSGDCQLRMMNTGEIPGGVVQIYSSNGQLVYQDKLETGMKHKELALTHLDSGIYYCVLTTHAGFMETGRLVLIK